MKVLAEKIGIVVCLAVVTGCTSSRDSTASSTSAVSTLVRPDSVPASTAVPSGSAPIDGRAGSLPDSVVERIENAYDYETVPTTLHEPLPTIVLPPFTTSPAQRAALTPPTTIKFGAVDNDAAAAAPDTRVPTTGAPAAPPSTASPPSAAPITVPDLDLDPARAERIVTAVSWPSGMQAVATGTADATGDAVASTFASDRQLRAAMQSAAGRVLQSPQGTGVIVGLVILDRGIAGPNPLAAARRSIEANGVVSSDLVSGVPALVLRANELMTIVAIDGERLAGAAGSAAQEALLRQSVTALLGRNP